MRLESLLRTDSPHQCSISWRIIRRTIFPWLTKIGVTYCKLMRSNIIGNGQRPKSRGLKPPNLHPNLTEMNPLEYRLRRGSGLVSVLTKNSKEKQRPCITGSRAIAYFSRSQECLSKSIFHIALRTVLESVLTNNPSRMD